MRTASAILLAGLLIMHPSKARAECNTSPTTGYPVAPAVMQDYTNWFTDADDLTAPHNGFKDLVPNPAKLPADRRYFCTRSETDLLDELDTKHSRLWFRNPKGPYNSGVCWWHSRFQRAAAYLCDFHPRQPKPTHEQALKLIADIRAMKHVVSIPGYGGLAQFSYDYRKEIGDELGRWEGHDLTFTTAAIKLRSDGKYTPAAELHSSMDALYERMLRKKQIVFQRHKIRTGVSHAWLVLGIVPRRAKDFYTIEGYRLNIVDSNFPNVTMLVDYSFGDTAVHYITPDKKLNEEMFPVTDFDDELNDLEDAVKDYCKAK